MSTETYLALKDCMAGGIFRKAGDQFEMPVPKALPVHLEKVTGTGKDTTDKTANTGKAARAAPVPQRAQVSKADIGAGTVTPVADVTSVDMVTQV